MSAQGRDYCRCRLSAKEGYYRARCPKCGLARLNHCSLRRVLPESLWWKRNDLCDEALQAYESVKRLCSLQRPKATPPRDPSRRTKSWEERAGLWEALAVEERVRAVRRNFDYLRAASGEFVGGLDLRPDRRTRRLAKKLIKQLMQDAGIKKTLTALGKKIET